MEKWDKNKFQGKRKDQVDYSYMVVFVGFLLLIIMLISSIVYNFS